MYRSLENDNKYIYIYIFFFIFVILNWSGYTFVSLLYIVVSNIDDGKSGSMMV